MIKLRGTDFILWKKDQKREKGVPLIAPHLMSVSKYTCYYCEKVFYYQPGDPETPQYITLRKKVDKHGFAKGAPVCHKDWHKYGCVGAIHSPACWLCELRNARKVRQDGDVRHTKSVQETSEVDGTPDFGIEPTTVPWKSSGVRRSVGLSSRRRSSKNKKNGKSR